MYPYIHTPSYLARPVQPNLPDAALALAAPRVSGLTIRTVVAVLE